LESNTAESQVTTVAGEFASDAIIYEVNVSIESEQIMLFPTELETDSIAIIVEEVIPAKTES